MPAILEKLRPDRDLQCYFERPSAVAALSATSPDGFTVSGTWRQQFDWAVIEWNRDNVFEHPSLRPLPDGDLSGLTLSYDETRLNCISMDSDLYPTVDWPSLRIWADDGTGEKIYRIPLRSYATAVEGVYQPASVQFTLGGVATGGDYVGLAFLAEHYWYQMAGTDTLEAAVNGLAISVNESSPTVRASANDRTLSLCYVGAGQTLDNSTTGANGNRIGIYTYTYNASTVPTEHWDAPSKLFSSGTSPTKWHVNLPFDSLNDPALGGVPATSIRKLRWTYAAALQAGTFQRSEFQVTVMNWSVTGTSRSYSLAGPGTRRIEDDSADIRYQGDWSSSKGNFSGGTLRHTTTPGSRIDCTYTFSQVHSLYLGSRIAENAASIAVTVDGRPLTIDLALPGEDVLVRKMLGQRDAGQHSVTISHSGLAGTFFYFDYIELAVPSSTTPMVEPESCLTLATDWDTDHSLALAPERTAWMINSLGFRGRVNHYAGALWFYELVKTGHQYASGTVTFSGTPDENAITEIHIGRADQPASDKTVISHLNLKFDTAETLALAFSLLLNNGYTGIWAEATANRLTIHSRSMGTDGNFISLDSSPSTSNLTIQLSGNTLAGGTDGDWRTDLQAVPRLNRAARDWSRSYYSALKGFGLDVTTAFSMELKDVDPSSGVGIAQRYPSQGPVLLNTPAIQTNFSPQSIEFWKLVYADMAAVQLEAGLVPYLQFGEVQWWYFPSDGSGMPFYDAYTTGTFRAQYGRDMAVITSNSVDPESIPQEAAFLPSLIGNFTSQVTAHVLANVPGTRFEVLYPTDVNRNALNAVINFPRSAWTPAALACLKTESFTYTFSRDLDSSKTTIDAGTGFGFAPAKRSHLIGVSDSSTVWLKEARMAEASGFESVVLFALDQFCLIGYSLPLSKGQRRSARFP